MQKIVSQLDADGYYVGATFADESPLEPGVYLLPAGAIDKEPPKNLEEGKRYRPWGSGWRSEDIPLPPDEEEAIPEEPIEPVFYTCSPWQIRKALNAANLRDAVETAVANSNDINLKDGWEFATEFRSDDPFVIAMGSAIELDETQIKEFVKEASYL